MNSSESKGSGRRESRMGLRFRGSTDKIIPRIRLSRRQSTIPNWYLYGNAVFRPSDQTQTEAAFPMLSQIARAPFRTRRGNDFQPGINHRRPMSIGKKSTLNTPLGLSAAHSNN